MLKKVTSYAYTVFANMYINMYLRTSTFTFVITSYIKLHITIVRKSCNQYSNILHTHAIPINPGLLETKGLTCTMYMSKKLVSRPAN